MRYVAHVPVNWKMQTRAVWENGYQPWYSHVIDPILIHFSSSKNRNTTKINNFILFAWSLKMLNCTYWTYLLFRDARYWIFCRYAICRYFTTHLADIDTCPNICVYFFPTPNCRDHQVFSAGEFSYSNKYSNACSYCVGLPANAGIKYIAYNYEIFIPHANKKDS